MEKETNALKERLFSAMRIAPLKINVEFAYRKHRRLYVRYRVRMQQFSETDSQSALADAINNPDASVGAQCSTFRTVCSIRWLQSALIPFVTTQASGY